MRIERPAYPPTRSEKYKAGRLRQAGCGLGSPWSGISVSSTAEAQVDARGQGPHACRTYLRHGQGVLINFLVKVKVMSLAGGLESWARFCFALAVVIHAEAITILFEVLFELVWLARSPQVHPTVSIG